MLTLGRGIRTRVGCRARRCHEGPRFDNEDQTSNFTVSNAVAVQSDLRLCPYEVEVGCLGPTHLKDANLLGRKLSSRGCPPSRTSAFGMGSQVRLPRTQKKRGGPSEAVSAKFGRLKEKNRVKVSRLPNQQLQASESDFGRRFSANFLGIGLN